MGPRNELVKWFQCFLRLGVEEGSNGARGMGWWNGFNVIAKVGVEEGSNGARGMGWWNGFNVIAKARGRGRLQRSPRDGLVKWF